MNPAQLSLPRRLTWGLPTLTLCVALLASLLLSTQAQAQAERVWGSGREASEVRSLPAFQAVSTSGSIALRVRQGAVQQVTLTADDNLLPLIETEVSGSGAQARLQVRFKRGVNVYKHGTIALDLTLPQLSAVSAAGSGDILVEAFETPSLSLRIAGSSDARLQQLKTAELSIGISGSGDVVGSGSATRLSIDIAGSGDVRLAELASDDVSVSIAGSGDAAVQAARSLEVRIAGSGDVVYSGNPARVNSRVAGSGSVNKR